MRISRFQTPTMEELQKEVNLIEEYTEYVFEPFGDNIYNDMRKFIHEHIREALDNKRYGFDVSFECDYVEVEY